MTKNHSWNIFQIIIITHKYNAQICFSLTTNLVLQLYEYISYSWCCSASALISIHCHTQYKWVRNASRLCHITQTITRSIVENVKILCWRCKEQMFWFCPDAITGPLGNPLQSLNVINRDGIRYTIYILCKIRTTFNNTEIIKQLNVIYIDLLENWKLSYSVIYS